jgi:FkbM family methyltransferase
MQLLNKIILKIKIEVRFYLEQKYGMLKPKDPINIPKYLLKKYLPSNPVIIDCGAHIGSDSIELARIFPNSKIFAFEAVPTIFKNLVKNTKEYKNIECCHLALSNMKGVASMYVSSGLSDASSSLLKPTGHIKNHNDVFFNEIIEVNTITLDEWAQISNVKHVDFLWLDMQGFELKMLKASPNLLKTVKAIHTEVSLQDSYENESLYNEYKIWLVENGFKVAIEAIPLNADMGNVLFIKK